MLSQAEKVLDLYLTRAGIISASSPPRFLLLRVHSSMHRALAAGRVCSRRSVQNVISSPSSARVVLNPSAIRCASSITDNAASSSEALKPGRTVLTQEQRKFLDRAMRVNQSGELAATMIYTAQTPPVVKAHPHLQPLMKHMYDHEAGHFRIFNELLAKHRIRPSAMYPVWQAASTVLGWTTGMMGKEAAMACTEAVETEIGNHYNSQVRELFKWMTELKEKGEELDPELAVLIEEVKRIRDEELEHLDHAVEHDAKEAQPYEPLTKVIQYGCKGAIWLSERT